MKTEERSTEAPLTRHVLVVDDDPPICMDAASMLESAGLEVVEFDRAGAAAIVSDLDLHPALVSDGVTLLQKPWPPLEVIGIVQDAAAP